ncbi:glycosyl transferase [Enterobacterales bacterium CwR94]|nr:glycosyl transferase [Enterobacterales bacterium CwR94]
MRILMIIDGLPGGGAEKVVLTLAEGMLAKHHQVTLLSLRDVCDYPLPAGLTYEVVADHCRHPFRKLTEISRRARQLDKAIARHQSQGTFDLVCSHLHKTDRIVSRSRALSRQNTWFCLHGVFSASYLGHRTGLSRWLKQQKIKNVYQHRNVVGVSEYVLADLQQAFGITLQRGEAIPNPFDIDAIEQLAQQPCPLAGQEYLVHVGRFHETKRHDRLIEAWAQSGISAPLVLLGKGSPAATQKLKALADKLGVGDRLILQGFVENPYPWIRHARLLVVSSDSEGFGNVLVEALICGTAIVSTRCPGGPEEIMTGSLARGLAPLSVEGLAKTLQDIYSAPPEIHREMFEKYRLSVLCDRWLALNALPAGQ